MNELFPEVKKKLLSMPLTPSYYGSLIQAEVHLRQAIIRAYESKCTSEDELREMAEAHIRVLSVIERSQKGE